MDSTKPTTLETNQSELINKIKAQAYAAESIAGRVLTEESQEVKGELLESLIVIVKMQQKQILALDATIHDT